MSDSTPVIEAALALSDAVDGLRFGGKVDTVYNPLAYAREPALDYLRRFARPGIEVLFMGMNPGPWGMAQTGVPFGAIPMVRDWLKVRGHVDKPAREHPARPVEGFDCERVEVSGTRLWGWLREQFGTPEALARRWFVWNYCPLVFMGDTGRNITPDKLRKDERLAVQAPCDEALRAVVTYLKPATVVGVGAWAERRARAALRPLKKAAPRVVRVLHPSPASPRANRGWAEQAEAELRAAGIDLPARSGLTPPQSQTSTD